MKQYQIWLALLAVYIVWGSTYLAIRFAVETIPPFLMAGVRFLSAGAMLYAWRRLAGDPKPTLRQWRSAAIVGGFLLIGGNGGVTWAEQYVPSGIAALMVGASPLWMVLLDALRRGGTRPNLMTSLGVLVGFGGIALLVGPAELGGQGSALHLPGILALGLSSFLWAVGSLYSRCADLPSSPLLGTGMEMLAGGAGLAVLGSLVGEWPKLDLAGISAASLWGLAYLIFFGALVGFAAYTWLLRNAPTPLVSTYAYVNPLIAVLMGSLLADETLTLRIGISALVIVSAVAFINTGRSKAAQSTTVPSPCTGVD